MQAQAQNPGLARLPRTRNPRRRPPSPSRRAALGGLAALPLLLALSGPGAARAGEPIPRYPAESNILATVPSADEGSIGATFNPAVWGLMQRAELDLWWSDRGVRRDALDNWGLAFGRHVGFSVRRHDFLDEDRRVRNVTDYQIGLGLGSRAGAVGLAYGWSGGDPKVVGREDFLTLGGIARPARWLSAGLSGRFALGDPAAEGLLDLAVRPLGDPRLLLFADYALYRKQTLDEGALAGGVALRPLAGLQAAFKYREGGAFQISLGLGLGRLGGQAIPRYDSDGDLQATEYVVRSSPQLPGADLDGWANRGRRVARMDLKGRLVYQKPRYGGDDLLALREVTERLRLAREDRTVAGVALNLSGLSADYAMVWELRRSLEVLRAAGKKVVVYCDNLDLAGYYLASAADRIVMDPQGILLAPGVQTSRTYMKDLLAKAGVGFDEWRYFRFKSAAERYSRDRMSEPDREQRQDLLDGYFAEFARGIVAAGRMSRSDLDTLLEARPVLLAQELRRRGWVDSLGSREDLEKAAGSAVGRKVKMVSFGKLEKLRREPDGQWGKLPRVALVYAVGECAMDTGIRGRSTSKALRRFRKDGAVKAVVLRADSPGGLPLPSDLLAREMKELRRDGKPIFASQGRVAASGGYWISMEADTITVSPFTITGSIGVIGGWVWNDSLGRKLGLASDHVQVGPSADLLGGLTLPLVGLTLPERNLDGRERALVKELILAEYDDFVARVAAARGLEESYVREIGEGRVYPGQTGIEKRIVDRVATLEETIAAAARAAGLPPGRKLEVVEYPKPPLFRLPSFMPSFVRDLAGGGDDAGGPDSDPLARLLPPTYQGWSTGILLRHPGRPLVLVPGDLLPDERPILR